MRHTNFLGKTSFLEEEGLSKLDETERKLEFPGWEDDDPIDGTKNSFTSDGDENPDSVISTSEKTMNISIPS